MEKVNLAERLGQIDEHWRPKTVATVNGQAVKLVKLQGEFVWHQHAEADELFLVLSGVLTIELRDRAIELHPGELLVVPRGVEHRPVAQEEVELLLFEPAELRNTGDVEHETLTAPVGAIL